MDGYEDRILQFQTDFREHGAPVHFRQRADRLRRVLERDGETRSRGSRP